MAPKIDLQDPQVIQLLELFSSISLTGQKAQDALKNSTQSSCLQSILKDEELNLESKGKQLDSKVNNLIVVASTTLTDPELQIGSRKYVVKRVIDESLKSSDQVITGCKYLASIDSPQESAINAAEFDKQTGVGIEITPEQVRSHIQSHISTNKSSLDESGGWPKVFQVINDIKAQPEMRWANALDVKNQTEKLFLEIWGEKPKPAPKGKNKEVKKEEKKVVTKVEGTKVDINAPTRPDAIFQEGFLSKLHLPGENPQISDSLKAEHLKATSGKVVTRFPPEPNGFLHIGHAKAIAIDFGYAKYHNGITYLRYDDTNPVAEEEQYFDSILEMVRWLGFEPFKITYSSDYFDRLFDLAVVLIKKGLAYVDHSTKEEIKSQRGVLSKEEISQLPESEREKAGKGGERKPSKWSSRSVEENLKEFQKMKDGGYKPGEAILRMKQDLLGSGNPQMWDLTAYRVLDVPHHRTGSTWRIYPTYDFTHCLVDSFENISHSLCTTEFILSRESYEWLCDALEVYKPRQYEFGRLTLEGTITSKRKILKLVNEGYIKDWDDPRMFTLVALRRRGIPPGALLSFVNQLGVTTSPSFTEGKRLDQTVRQYLESITPRLMMILDPVKIKITNLEDDYVEMISKPLHPKVPEMGENTVPFTKDVYIDSSDFRTEDEKGYLRLAPGKSIGLMNVPGVITCTGFTTSKSDPSKIEEIQCTYEGEPKTKCKTYIQWISKHKASKSPVRIHETRIFHPLFNVADPGSELDFEKTVNKNSLEVYKESLIEIGFWKVARTAMKNGREEALKREEKVKSDDAIQATSLTGGESETPVRKLEHLVGKECVRFQGMRIAYFALDKDSILKLVENEDLKEGEIEGLGEGERIVLNRIVSLKEDKEKDSK